MNEMIQANLPNRQSDTEVAIHPLLAGRYSPRSFDDDFEIDPETITSLLEAARWAPSALNIQPRRFIVGRRGDKTFSTLVNVLKPTNQIWAERASILLCGMAVTHDDAGNPLHYADYDLGQSVAHITFQVGASGLRLRQIGGFDADLLVDTLPIPVNCRPRIILAIGREADLAVLSEELASREKLKRTRLSLDELVIGGIRNT